MLVRECRKSDLYSTIPNVVSAGILIVVLAVGCGSSAVEPGEAAAPTTVPVAESEPAVADDNDVGTTTEEDEVDDVAGEAVQAADEGDDAEDELFPNVIAAELVPSGDRTFNVSATIDSAYDTPERYADAWRILTTDGVVLGVRELGHDHQNEQPFTRSLSNVSIPAEITSVIIEGRDQISGWGGDTVTVDVPG